MLRDYIVAHLKGSRLSFLFVPESEHSVQVSKFFNNKPPLNASTNWYIEFEYIYSTRCRKKNLCKSIYRSDPKIGSKWLQMPMHQEEEL